MSAVLTHTPVQSKHHVQILMEALLAHVIQAIVEVESLVQVRQLSKIIL